MENIYTTESSKDYELLDSGNCQKLERFGDVIISRPDPQAIWERTLAETEWKKADAIFGQTSGRGKWLNRQGRSPDQNSSSGLGHMKKPFPEDWRVEIEGINFLLKPSVFKHIGVFPEQSVHWKWLREKIEYEYTNKERKISVLNLFGYTGGASLACAKAGANVCHVDSSQFSVDCAMKNRDASGLSDKPIRFIVEDVRKFVDREIRRGNKYDVILLDPPVYGKGSKDEIWKIEEDLVPLLSKIKKLLSDNPIAIILNGYASGYSHATYGNLLSDMTKDFNVKHSVSNKITSGELVIKESKTERLLPAGIFARWEV